MRRAAAVTILAATFAIGGATPGQTQSHRQYNAEISKLSEHLRERISGVSWHRGCPVPMRKLRVLRLTHLDFDREPERGRLILHYRYAKPIAKAFGRLYRVGFPIRRMKLIDRYGADDRRSMAADNTSAFNCREVAGRPGVWSQHAYGRAIDINPIENPYVTGSGYVSPPAGAPFADRSRKRKGMVNDRVVVAFRRAGWEWGGDWPGTKDFQHFSSNGR